MLLTENLNELRTYVLNKFNAEGDFSFLKPVELERMVDSMIALDTEFMERTGAFDDAEYDDDAAYEHIFEAMKKLYPGYQMYCMRLSEDYLDFSEEYLDSIGAIEWD